MLILPAIDIKNKEAVRLFQGNYDKVTVYSKDPMQIVRQFEKAGTKIMHLIDLDAAKIGKSNNQAIIKKILKNAKIKVEIGGGIRTEKDIRDRLKWGAYRVILGTKATKDMGFVTKIAKKYGEQIVIGVDAKDGKVMIHGWKKTSPWTTVEIIKRLEKAGIKRVIFTDIKTDGALTGPNISALEKISKITKMQIIASGGVSNMEDIKKLSKMKVEGAIVGKAIYEKKIDLKKAIKLYQ